MANDFENIILVTPGGIGKNIAATAIVPAIKKKHPDKKVVIIASHTDIWLYHPDVHRIFNFNNPLNVYDDYFDNSLILNIEPYLNLDYARRRKHLIDAFLDVYNLNDGQQYTPILHLIKREINSAIRFLKNINNNSDDFSKIILFQWVGGWLADPKQCNCNPEDIGTRFEIGQQLGYRRSLPKNIAQGIVNKLVENGFSVIEISGFEFEKLENTIDPKCHIRGVIALLPHVRSFIGIDSFLQHASAAIKKPGMVLWGGTSPDCLGYNHNYNYFLKDSCEKLFCHRPNSYFFDNQGGYNWNCEYDEPCLQFNPDDVFNRFLKFISVAKEE